MALRALMLATVAAVSISVPAMAQVISEVEGKLVELGEFTTTPAYQAKVFGTKVILKDAAISTPTREDIPFPTLLTCNNAKIPGFVKRPAGGSMVGGTIIATGSSNGDGTITAETAFFEPAENVLLGQVTNVPLVSPEGAISGKLEIDGTEVVVIGKKRGEQFPPAPLNPTTGASTEIWNPCFPGKGVKNASFIDIPPQYLSTNAEAAAEGWFGEDGIFYAFLIEGNGSAKEQPLAVSAFRAQCRNRGAGRGLEWEIRGGVGHPENVGGSIVIGQTVAGRGFVPYGIPSVNPLIDPLDDRYGTFQIRADLIDSTVTTCPINVVVRYQPILEVPPPPPTTENPDPKPQRFIQSRVGVDAR
ncbi:hypothetical protein GGE65_005979 [Skermanella aerolata]|uniref:hypothetical protein n=1 Tax=Skermanella aerolata TaxID=393310 RepID=UPI003D1D372C